MRTCLFLVVALAFVAVSVSAKADAEDKGIAFRLLIEISKTCDIFLSLCSEADDRIGRLFNLFGNTGATGTNTNLQTVIQQVIQILQNALNGGGAGR